MEQVSVLCDGNELQLTDLPAAILAAAANAADARRRLPTTGHLATLG